MRCLVTDILPETTDTHTFKLGTYFPYKAGQAISLLIPGDPKKRYYSLSSSPTEKDSLAITIKLDDKSKALFASAFTLKKGSSVDIEGPFGSFVLPDQWEGPLYYLAGGSGVTPFRSLIKFVMDTRPSTEQWLFHSAKDPDDLIFKEEFMTWSRNPLFHYVPTFTRWDSPDQKAETGRIGEALLKRHLPLMEGTFFLCGSKEFSSNMEHILLGLHVPPARIRREQW